MIEKERKERASVFEWENVPNSKTRKVVRNVVAVGSTAESDAVLRLGHVHGWCDMIGETTVLVEVDN